MDNTLITLAEFHYELGYIGHDEYLERINVALWLSDTNCGSDPRLDGEEEQLLNARENEEKENEYVVSKTPSGKGGSSEDQENSIEFICLGVWVFTKADKDPYPSIPHGHYRSQNKSWPKLNPYNGRVFKSKHQEDLSQRLSKKDMRNIWQDEKFKSFCREMIVWYQEQFPHYEFPVRRQLRLPRW